jgi:hypothetical protein
MGLPFIAVRGLLASDILTYRPDFLVRDNPFNPGEQVVLAAPFALTSRFSMLCRPITGAIPSRLASETI